MIELIKKDWRLNRGVVVGNVILIATWDLVIAGTTMWNADLHSRNAYLPSRALVQAILAAGVSGIGLTVLLASVYGGIAFALERRERWGDFLNMLPVRRRTIVLSKIIVAWSSMFGMLLLNCLVIGCAVVVVRNSGGRVRDIFSPDVRELIALASGVAIMLFGVAWMFSSFMQSPVLSACIAIPATFVAAFLFMSSGWDQSPRFQMMLRWACAWSMMAIGVTAFVAGTAYYLRRVEP